MGGEQQLEEAVHWLDKNLSFDLDERVHVFELTIRALGEQLPPSCLVVLVGIHGTGQSSQNRRHPLQNSSDGPRPVLRYNFRGAGFVLRQAP